MNLQNATLEQATLFNKAWQMGYAAGYHDGEQAEKRKAMQLIDDIFTTEQDRPEYETEDAD